VAELLVIVPTRSRPHAVERVAAAWYATGAFEDGAGLVFVVDSDDPAYPEYRAALDRLAVADPGPTTINMMNGGEWLPMVPKLNRAADNFAGQERHFALGFAGDDHLPRSRGWAGRYVAALRQLGTGIVYGNDLIQGERLPTQWAMTSDIVRALGGRMVPAPVDHLYCDNAVMALGVRAGCLRYLSDVVVEHVHPIALKAPTDAQYKLVNAPGQYRRDGATFRRWVRDGLAADVEAVQALRTGSVVHG
jgi:hypothetical protein